MTAADIRPKCHNKRRIFSSSLLSSLILASIVCLQWPACRQLMCSRLGSRRQHWAPSSHSQQQLRPAVPCLLPVPPDLLQKGNQGKPLTDCSLPPPMVLAAAAAPNFLPGNRAARLQAIEASSNSPAMLRRQVALLQEQTAGIR